MQILRSLLRFGCEGKGWKLLGVWMRKSFSPKTFLVRRKLTFRNLFGSTIYYPFDSKCSWGYSNTTRTANTFRGRRSRPPSWCIDQRSVASTSRSWRSMWNLLKLSLMIYDDAQQPSWRSLASFDCCSIAVEWLALDWFALECLSHRRCPLQNCSSVEFHYSSRWLSLSSAVAALSFRWELQQVEIV